VQTSDSIGRDVIVSFMGSDPAGLLPFIRSIRTRISILAGSGAIPGFTKSEHKIFRFCGADLVWYGNLPAVSSGDMFSAFNRVLIIHSRWSCCWTTSSSSKRTSKSTTQLNIKRSLHIGRPFGAAAVLDICITHDMATFEEYKSVYFRNCAYMFADQSERLTAKFVTSSLRYAKNWQVARDWGSSNWRK
jgi:hypothetical protein